MTTEKLLQSDDGKVGRLLVALELSLSKWRLAMAVAGAERKRCKVIEGGDYSALAKEIMEAKARFGLAPESDVVLCYEAGRDGFAPYRMLTAAGHTVWVIDSSSIEVNRKRRRAKSDAIDAEALLGLLQRYVGGERRALRVIAVPSVEAEDLRQLPREREELLRERRRLLNRMESLVFAQGYRALPGTAGAIGRWLEARVGLGVHLRERLTREVTRLKQVEEQLRAIATEQQALLAVPAAGPGERIIAVARQLQGLCGIAWVSAWVLAAELLGWREFRNRRQVAGALGLVSTPYDSGETQREQGISKAGNHRARALLVQVAWSWLRYQPQAKLSQWFAQRFAHGGKRLRRIGIVALARRLAVLLWRYVTTAELPADVQIKPAA
jgi:transposase